MPTLNPLRGRFVEVAIDDIEEGGPAENHSETSASETPTFAMPNTAPPEPSSNAEFIRRVNAFAARDIYAHDRYFYEYERSTTGREHLPQEQMTMPTDNRLGPMAEGETRSLRECYPNICFPDGVVTYQDALDWGYRFDLSCNCEDCRTNRMARHFESYARDPKYHKMFEFQPMREWEYSYPGLFPKADPRFPVSRHYLTSAIRYGETPIRISSYVLDETLLKKCSFCGTLHFDKAWNRTSMHASEVFLLPDGKTACRDCFESGKHIYKCDHCGRIESAQDKKPRKVNMTDRARMLCPTCFRECVVKCRYCGTALMRGTERTANNHTYCIRCFNDLFFECCDCGRTHPRTSLLNDTREGRQVCGDCFRLRWRLCSECGYAYRHNDNERPMCPTCTRATMGRSDLLMNYSFKPNPQFRRVAGENENALHYGVELECENVLNKFSIDQQIVFSRNYWAEKGETGLCYYKSDGSLSYGMEIVSHPMTYAWLMKHRAEWVEYLSRLRERGMRSYNTSSCGLHIHLSKKAFGGTRLYKFLKFFHENEDFVWKISGRVSLQAMSAWAKVDTEGATRNNLAFEARNQRKRDGSRRWAVNMLPPNTIEIRIFKGTLGEGSFFRAFEFLKSVYDFCEKGVVRISETTLPRYLQFVREDRSADYPLVKARIENPKFNLAEHEEAKEN